MARGDPEVLHYAGGRDAPKELQTEALELLRRYFENLDPDTKGRIALVAAAVAL